MEKADGDSMECSEPQTDPLALQRKTFLNEELQKIARDLPSVCQQRIPNGLLCALADSLVDGMVFKIVWLLINIHHMTEDQLNNQRTRLLRSHRDEIDKLKKKHKNALVLYMNTEILKLKHEMQLEEFDQGCILTLNERLHEQQKYMMRAGVPGFEITSDPLKILDQAQLFEFIMQLSGMKMPE